MRYALIFICCLLMASTVMNCAAVRTNANQIRVARVRRLDEAEGN